MSCLRCNSEVATTKDGATQLGGQRFRCGRLRTPLYSTLGLCVLAARFPDNVIALAIRWYVRYRLSYADVSEWLAERGILVDQSTIYRWVQRFLPLFGDAARQYRHPVSPDWRVDETYARIRGLWHYVYRAIDGHGQIVDAYVSPTRDLVAARTFFEQAIACSGSTLRRVITHKAVSYPPALAAAVPGVLHRTGRYRTNGIERDNGFLKRATAADARTQVGCFGGDLHARSRADAQHPPSVLPDRGVRAAAARLRVGLEQTCWSGVIRQKTGGRPMNTSAGGCYRHNPTSMQENPINLQCCGRL